MYYLKRCAASILDNLIIAFINLIVLVVINIFLMTTFENTILLLPVILLIQFITGNFEINGIEKLVESDYGIQVLIISMLLTFAIWMVIFVVYYYLTKESLFKKVFGLKVTNKYAIEITNNEIIRRNIFKSIFMIFLPINLVMILLLKDNQTIYDLILDTYVI